MADPFFGPRWDAPVVDHADQVPTPVGRNCYRCGEPVAAGDRGMIRNVMRSDGTGGWLWSPEPIHAECELISVMGHDVGICHCNGYDTSTRAAARLTWDRVGQLRGRDLNDRGHPS